MRAGSKYKHAPNWVIVEVGRVHVSREFGEKQGQTLTIHGDSSRDHCHGCTPVAWRGGRAESPGADVGTEESSPGADVW